MDEQKRNDDELFAALNRAKRKKRRKKLLTALIITAVIVTALLAAISYLRGRVEASIASDAEEVLSYTVRTGSVSTTVTGSGVISDVDTEEVTVPEGVELDEVKAEANTRVKEGDILATVDMASVLSALAGVQQEIDELDGELSDAASDAVSATVTAPAAGRVKKLYVERFGDVLSCMYEHGALALLSLDGYMAVDVETGALSAGDSVTVIRADGRELTGTVETALGGVATVLLTDNGPELDEAVSIRLADGTELSGVLYIHNPLAVTGFAGTVNYVYAKENQTVYAGSTLCTLTDTSYSARYDTILKERREKEETLLELLSLRQSGALLSPFDGTVLTVDYNKSAASQAANTSQLSGYAAAASAASTAAPASATSDDGTKVVTMARDERMSVTISVDETDILSLQLGQTAEITLDSLGDGVYMGEVTEIDKTATSASGVTAYSATVTFDKAENMLSGMTADVVVRIQGTENVLIVPAEAVHKTSAFSFVYTEYDAEAQTYGGMTPVETGISNDDFTEIVSGLREGDTVYYTETESNDFFAFGGGFGGNGGGNRPNGGGDFPGRS